MLFFEYLSLSKGTVQSFKLENWQKFIICSLFGWKRFDVVTGKFLRLYTEAYVEVAKKNGKTTLASGIALYLLLADREPGSEVYVAAFTRDQANICFREAKNMLLQSPTVLNKTGARIFSKAITVPSTFSDFQAVSHDAKNTEGKNSHGVILDEYHVHRTDEVKNSLSSGSAAREQPLMFVITTAGFDRQGPCYKHRTDLLRVLDGHVELDHIFITIFAIDEEDDWNDEACWHKANPNLGVSVRLEKLRDDFKLAQQSGTKEVDFKTKHLNQWVDAAEVWIKDKEWMDCLDLEKKFLPDKKIFGGMDFATIQDFCACALLSEIADDEFVFRCWFWISQQQYDDRRLTMPNIKKWRDDGWLSVCPGNTIDLGIVHRDIKKIFTENKIFMAGYDNFKSDPITQPLTEEFGQVMGPEKKYVDRIQPYGQSMKYMSAPTKEFERMVRQKKVFHDGNPVFRWMLGNVTLYRDSEDNYKPDKGRSSEKIDGPVAGVIATGMWLDNRLMQPYKSVYETGAGLLI